MKSYSLIKIVLIIFVLVTNAGACSKGKAESETPEAEKPPGTEQEMCKKCLLLAEQSQNRVIIVDAGSGKTTWEWTAGKSNVRPEHVSWFNLPDEAKLVYGGQYILITASGGGVALVRIKDKKALFYAFIGGNPHSAELLPDGNIVTASSSGNKLTLLQVDTAALPDTGFKRELLIEDGHNVVWDMRRNVLWATSNTLLKAFTYDNNCKEPNLKEVESIKIPDYNAHDLFPVYSEDALWMTTANNIYKVSLHNKVFTILNTDLKYDVKSISDGPAGYPTILIKPKEEWWTDEVKDVKGNKVFQQNGYKIYKGRWMVENTFSYPKDHQFKQCK